MAAPAVTMSLVLPRIPTAQLTPFLGRCSWLLCDGRLRARGTSGDCAPGKETSVCGYGTTHKNLHLHSLHSSATRRRLSWVFCLKSMVFNSQ